MATKYNTPTIEELFDAGVHFGHQVRRWNPKMAPYIFDVRKNIHIIDLEKTEELLKKACEFLYETAKKGEQIIFVGTKKQASELIKLEARRCGALYVTDRWLGGTITNFRVIKRNIDKLVNLKRKREEGEFAKYTKKERLLIDRDIEKLENSVGGLVSLKGAPGAVFVIDTKREKTAIREAFRKGVPSVALVDTNSDPSTITYVVPGNDDAIKSILVTLRAITNAVEAGYKDFEKEKEKKGKKEEPVEVLENTKAAK